MCPVLPGPPTSGDPTAVTDAHTGPVPSASDEPLTPQHEARAFEPLWQRLLGQLVSSQRAWLDGSRPYAIHRDMNLVVIAVGNEFFRQQIEQRLRPTLEQELSLLTGFDSRLAVTVDPDFLAELPPLEAERDLGPAVAADVDSSTQTHDDRSTGASVDMSLNDRIARRDIDEPASDPTAPTTTGSAASSAPSGDADSSLNPKYSFDTFVIGSSNRFAHAAAIAVAEAPGRAYNPLLIYGDSGLGKTHLLHAVGHYVRSMYASMRVRYVSSEEFTNEFINSIRDNDRNDRFKRRYRDVDVLLIDDIQFLEGKIQTQEEFFHTFNALHNAGKQIVITSDRPPKRLEALEDRLRSRFEWGLTTDVQPPDLETRIAILRKKAAQERLDVPADVLEFIASKIATNIRELEGALIRVTAFANLNRQRVDATLAEIVLKDVIPTTGEVEVTPGLILAQTAAFFDVSIDDLCSGSRNRALVNARQIGMYLCRELTGLSLPKIGQHFGNRDHSTVLYAERKIREALAEKPTTYNQVAELTTRIRQAARSS
ncbi:chromosomal replication initiator protein DnaA [Nocardioidaceae bacterium]|nr:chromosomal replication initiator protein DnaA [Nocardioidaceae bacterium]